MRRLAQTKKPPRRLSMDDMAKDPVLWNAGMNVDVFLDGVKQNGVTRYDIDGGTIERYVKHEPTTETVRGKVEVRWKVDDA